MRLVNSLSLTLLALALSGGSGSAALSDTTSVANPMEAADKSIIAEERDHNQVMANLEYLSDMIGPRLTGSDRLLMANRWTEQKMKDYGLQNVHLEAYTIPKGWVRGTLTARISEPNGLPISAAQQAWTPGTHGRITAPVVMMNVDKEEDLAAYKGRLHGAFVLMGKMPANPDEAGALELPDQKKPDPIPALSSPAPSVKETKFDYKNFNYKKYMALRKAISAFVKSEGIAGTLRDAGKPYNLLNMTGSWEGSSTTPTLFVAHENVLMMERLIHHNQPVTLEVSSTAHFVRGPITVYNTVGEIRGMTKPDEVVLMGGHLDSWDLGTGSTDNGTGSMAALEAARLITACGLKPARTMRFVLFTGEEEGLHGSRAYVEQHKSEMSNIDVVFIHDTGTGRVRGAWLQDRALCKPMLNAQFEQLKALGLLTDEIDLQPNKMNGTDHASFDDAGVPAFAFEQEEANYELNHHSQGDTFDKVRPDDLKQGACSLAIMGYNAAQMPERYPRSPAPTAEGGAKSK